MSFELVALSPALFFSLSSIMTRRGLDGSTPHTGSLVVLFMQLFFFSFCLAAVDFSKISPSVYWLAFLAAGLSSPALSLLFLYRSIQRVGVAPTSAISNTHAISGRFGLSCFWENARPSSCGWGFSSWWPVFSGCRAEEVRSQGDGCCFCRFSRPLFRTRPHAQKNGAGGVDSLVFGGFLQSLSACAVGPFFLKMSTGWRPFVFNRPSLINFLLGGARDGGRPVMPDGRPEHGGEVSRVSPMVATAPLLRSRWRL